MNARISTQMDGCLNAKNQLTAINQKTWTNSFADERADFLKALGIQNEQWIVSLANKKFVDLPVEIRYLLENPGEVQRCGICSGIILDEPHYDCQAELHAIQRQEERGDMEYFAPGGGAEEDSYYGSYVEKDGA